MKTITQRSISKRLGLDPSFFCKLINGKQRPSALKAANLEVVTGIGIRTWLFGKPVELKRELERVYGKINFKRGRLPGKAEVKK
jgi:transcriptional regulator with XRE-family HTH domain